MSSGSVAALGAAGSAGTAGQAVDAMERDVTAKMSRTSPVVYVAAMLAPLILAFALREALPPWQLLSWLGCMLALGLCRWLLVWASRRAPEAPRWPRLLDACLLSAGLGWAVMGGWFSLQLAPEYQALAGMVLAGVSAAGICAYGAGWRVVATFLGLCMLPYALACALVGGPFGVVLAALACAHCLGMMLLRRQLQFEQQSAELIAALQHARREADLVNTRLRAEVAERAATESALREAKVAAEQAARAKSQFLATMSHEIRTPMNGVLGMTDLLLGTELSSKQRHFAETVRKSAEALLALINDVLDFSKVEAGKLELESRPFDLRLLLEDAAELFAGTAHAKGVELISEVPEALPAAFRGDAGRLRQVVVNLLSNAVKFTARGEVVLKAGVLELDEHAARLRLEVRDTGPGIAPEWQNRVFEVFSQAEDSDLRRHGGTGLGLAICRNLILLMGGRIGLDSRPGEGSTFWVELELPRAGAGELPKPPRPARLALDGVRILVADDNETGRGLLVRQLRAWQADCQGCCGGEAAVSALREATSAGRPFAVAILGSGTDTTDALAFARTVRQTEGIAPVAAVALTSVIDLAETGQWMLRGIDACLTKPVRQAELADCLSRLLGERSGQAAPRSADAPSQRPPSRSRIDGRVLVAEDNPVNQELVLSMLEALGCRVELAENGRLALDVLLANPLDQRRDPFDLVLMDCQMPEMDGFAATREIRRHERAERLPALPVIALTANALKGDRERCLQAGMSDYLTKPFTAEQLRGMLEKWMPLRADAGADAAAPDAGPRPAATPDRPVPRAAAGAGAEPPPARSVIDPAALDRIRAVGTAGNARLLERIIRLFLQDAPRQLDTLHTALENDDADAVVRAAHSLKSSSANVGATELAEASRELEALGKAGDLVAVSARMPLLEFHQREAAAALAKLLPEPVG